MNAFGVKNVLRKAVLTENFSCNKASDIYDYLIKHLEQDPHKKYFLLESGEQFMQRSPKRRHATSKIAEATTFVSTLIGVFKPNKISALAITAFRGDSSHALKKKDHSCTISKQQIIPHTLPLNLMKRLRVMI